jgi:energy-coupling factor transporter ATP-binding protein EcfA2
MKKLELINFKAHKKSDNGETLKIDLTDNKNNFLLYGDNGAGKSSIFEAIKVIFFKDKISDNIQNVATDEEQEQKNNEFWSKFNNKITNEDFEININNSSYSDFVTTDYQTFMFSLDELYIEDSIRLDNLLKRFHFNLNSDIDTFCNSKYQTIQDSVNIALESFREKIQIEIDKEDDYTIKVIDIYRNLESKVEIKKYFNEAKLNLITLLLIFESIKVSKDDELKKILVLDDFITSLDVANRTFLMQYVFDNFKDFQILIFTHNVYFYNLIMYLIKDIYSTDNKLKQDRWVFSNLYEINGVHKLYIKNPDNRVSQIRDALNAGVTPPDEIGNKIRQRFEVLLYEFSKLFMVGAVEDSKKILERIENSKSVFFKKKITRKGKNKTASDLVDELGTLISNGSSQNDLNSKISEYKKDGFRDIQDTIRKLKLYQKVTLHPMSHGAIGQSSFTINEIDESLDLLEKFETYLKNLIDNDVDGA